MRRSGTYACKIVLWTIHHHCYTYCGAVRVYRSCSYTLALRTDHKPGIADEARISNILLYFCIAQYRSTSFSNLQVVLLEEALYLHRALLPWLPMAKRNLLYGDLCIWSNSRAVRMAWRFPSTLFQSRLVISNFCRDGRFLCGENDTYIQFVTTQQGLCWKTEDRPCHGRQSAVRLVSLFHSSKCTQHSCRENFIMSFQNRICPWTR